MNIHFANQWLAILCHTLSDAYSAVLLMPEDDSKTVRPMAQWPVNLSDITDFTPVIQNALKTNQPVSIVNSQQADDKHYDYYALPVFIQSELLAIIALKTLHLPADRQETVLQSLQQGAQWLSLANNNQDQTYDNHFLVLRLLAACFEQKNYAEVLIRLVSELTVKLDCDRVALGQIQSQHSKVVALSNSAHFDSRSNFMQKIADAMDEAIAQDSLIRFPNPQATIIQRAHLELSRKFGSGALLTIPMWYEETAFGAITFFRSEEKPFDNETVSLCELTVSLICPFLALKKSAEQPLTTLVTKTLKRRLSNLLSFKYLKVKLTVASLMGLILVMSLLKGDYQLTADAMLEGKLQRVVTAPISGFLLSASVRAGDTVHKGDVMANLDGSELQLQLGKLNGQLQKFRREYREALSTGDLVKVRINSAQIDQATAEMELTQQQLQKITLTAPFDSVVIEGDLSQMLGSPVERGDTLFKIAPLEGYRIILKVDERLISYVKPGQKGTLALSSMPERKLQLTVQKITAIAKADNGGNIFRVEASLDRAPDLLRPGMEGIGKIKCRAQESSMDRDSSAD